MISEEIAKAITRILAMEDKHSQLAAYANFVDSLPEAERIAAHTALDALRIQSQLIASRQIWVLVHGMNTEAPWQDLVRSELAAYEHIQVECVGYEFYDIVRFLFPILGRRRVVAKVRDDLRQVISNGSGARIGIISHSFGTYIVTRVLRENTDIRVSALLLCGSIVSRRFRWDKLPNKPRKGMVVNDVGLRDHWPIAAGAIDWNYGPSGSFGFKGPHVRDRYFDLGHSDFFSLDHIRSYWFPFILNGEVKEGAADASRPTPSAFVSWAGTPWVQAALYIGVAWGFWQAIRALA